MRILNFICILILCVFASVYNPAYSANEKRIEFLLATIPPLVMKQGQEKSGFLWDLVNSLTKTTSCERLLWNS